MTYREAITKLKEVFKACIDLGMDVDTILELNKVCVKALELADRMEDDLK